MLRSSLCTQGQLEDPLVARWWTRMGFTPLLHRKVWEICFIAQALSERDMLRPGRRGLGFGVGTEPLAAYFASLGCEIVATDQDEETARAGGWVHTQQHAQTVRDLDPHKLCPPDELARLVTFRPVDMNRIPRDLTGFDFCWSACAFEHLGSLERGQRFIQEMTRCLVPGGIGVHTTEFNLGSNDATLDRGPTVLFRQKDTEDLARRLAADGHEIDLDLSPGTGDADFDIDRPPYRMEPHLKLQVDQYISTSVGLIVHKSRVPRSPSTLENLIQHVGRWFR